MYFTNTLKELHLKVLLFIFEQNLARIWSTTKKTSNIADLIKQTTAMTKPKQVQKNIKTSIQKLMWAFLI